MAGCRGLGEIEEDSESPEAGPVLEQRIFVAVGKEVKESKATLLWALRDARGKKVYILHVHQQAQFIPMPMGGKFPASKLTPREVKQYRQQEWEKMQQTLDEYMLICAGARVQAEKLVIERDDIEKGIVELVVRHGITNLVMGAAADKNYSKKMREPKSKKAIYVAREAQLSCHISFVCKGIPICTSGASLDGTRVWMTPPSPISSPSTSGGPSIRLNARSASLGQVGTPSRRKNYVLDFLIRSKSEGVATGMGVDTISNLSLEETQALAMPEEGSGDQCGGMSKSNSQGSMSSTWSTIEGGVGSSPSLSMERDIDSVDGSLLPLVSELEEGGYFTPPSDEQICWLLLFWH